MKKKAASPRQETEPTALQPRSAQAVDDSAPDEVPAIVDEAALLDATCENSIQSARQRIATVANATHDACCAGMLGRRLQRRTSRMAARRMESEILATVSRELTAEFGGGFSYAAVNRAHGPVCPSSFPDEAIVSTLSTQLSWSHFIELLPIKDPLARDFYAEMCRIERWDVRTLRHEDRRHVVPAHRAVEESRRPSSRRRSPSSGTGR